MEEFNTASEIKQLRAQYGLTQAEFSEKFDIPKRTIENWESGCRKCPRYVVELLKKVAAM